MQPQKSVNRSGGFQPKVQAKSAPKADYKNESTETTHYAYTLKKDDGGQTVREFIQNVRIYEQPSKHEGGEPYLKIQILGPLPESGNVFVAKRRPKD